MLLLTVNTTVALTDFVCRTILLIYLLFISVLCCADKCSNEVNGQERTSTMDEAESCTISGHTSNALAVVLYDENSVLPLHKQERVFNFANHQLRIKQDWMGTGIAAVVWDSAEVLSQYLEQNPHLVEEKSVLELGAGTGLVGMVVALLGGMVTITDRQQVLHIPEQIVAENLSPPALERTKVRALDWTTDLDKYDADYDVILGADIVYIEEGFPDLLKALIKLSTRGTLILLSCRIRYDRDSNFIGQLEDHFTVEKIVYDKATDVLLYKLIKLDK